MRNDLLFPQKLSKLALFLGGVNEDGFLVGWFKTAKHRFGLHRFGQGTLLGVYRWLVLSLISYVLAHWAYLSTSGANGDLPDWGEAAEIAFQTIFPHLAVLLLLQDIERLRELALSQGINIEISRCKI
ncbi:hypothetical protein [Dulcicalothrix desertica]